MISLKSKSQGFTIVELLIVIVVIGILAALVITTFTGIQQKARDTKRKTDIGAIEAQLEAFYAQNGGGYPALVDLQTAAWVASNLKGLDPTAFCDPSNAATPCTLAAAAVSGSGGKYGYAMLQADGVTACAATTGNTCPKFTLTANLEGGGTFSKNSLN